MSMLEKYVEFVNEQIAFQGKMAKKFEKDAYRKNLHEMSQNKFTSLRDDLIEADKFIDKCASNTQGDQLTPSGKVRTNLTPQEIEDLPDELLKELSISDSDKTEFAILALLSEAGGIMSLDQLIVGLFKKTGEVHKRTALTSKLYRMSQKEQVFSVPNKKGVYSTRLLNEEEADSLISG